MEQISSILKNKLWVYIDNVFGCFGRDVVNYFQIVKKTDKVRNLSSENPVRVFALYKGLKNY